MSDLSGEQLISSAYQLAVAAHEGQFYGDRPYIEHPLEVADYARGLGYGPEVIAACLLHDTIEDTAELEESRRVTPEKLRLARMPLVVVEGVVAVTWEGNGDLDAKIAQAMSHPVGHVCKFCDSGRNFATTANDPFILGQQRAMNNSLRYGGNLGKLAIGLPTPEEIDKYVASRAQLAA